MPPSAPPPLPDPPLEIEPLIVDGRARPWRLDLVCPPTEVSPPPWRKNAPPPAPVESYRVDVPGGLYLETWRSLTDRRWGLKATLPGGRTDWVPALDDGTDRYPSLAAVWKMSQWLATRFVQATPKPRSIDALLGLETIRASDQRLDELRAAYCAALWWQRALSELHAGVEHLDVQRAKDAREQARAEYRAGLYRLQEQAVTAWRRARYAEQQAGGGQP